MNRARLPLFLLFALAFLVLVPNVYAADEDAVNLSEFPDQLVIALTIPLFAAQILASSIVLSLFLLPTVFACSQFNKDVAIPSVFVGFLALSFCIAVTWLPYWILIIVAILVALMFGNSIKGFVSGGQGG